MTGHPGYESKEFQLAQTIPHCVCGMNITVEDHLPTPMGVEWCRQHLSRHMTVFPETPPEWVARMQEALDAASLLHAGEAE
jgi:hypothetical protein